jgi:hypothetical protein
MTDSPGECMDTQTGLSSRQLNGREILCVTTCEVYVPLPGVEHMGTGTLERVRKRNRILHPHGGLCNLYLLTYPLASNRKSLAMDFCSSQQSVSKFLTCSVCNVWLIVEKL